MNYKKYIPADSPVGLFMEYMESLETARSYDFWSAMWALGSACGREVFVDRPRIPVYMNWYIILCAESGITRKTTAVIRARQWFTDAFGSDHIVSGTTNAPSLRKYLGEMTHVNGRAEAFIGVSELATVLGRGSESVGLPILLTDLYDCEKEKVLPGTIRDGEVLLRNVFVTLLSASTPTWLATTVSQSVVEGGFTSRVMFVTDETRKKSIAWPKPDDVGLWNRATSRLREVATEARRVGGIHVSDGAKSALATWYKNRVVNRSPFLSSFDAREDDHALRLAACLSINDGTYEIQRKHITAAIQGIQELKSKANDLFGGGYNESARLGDGIDKIRTVLIEAGMDGMEHKNLYARCRYRLDTLEFNTLIRIMHEANMIQIFDINKGTKKHPKMLYRATVRMQGLGVTSDLLARVNLPRGSA